MRLLLTSIHDGQLKFVEFSNLPSNVAQGSKDSAGPPEHHRIPYAILSHTWGKDEITFQAALSNDPSIRALSGYTKILGCCEQARKDGYEFVWIDTCCIDKTSSSELSEAINSMHTWYQMAAVCYAYLEDVACADGADKAGSEFRRCRWFTRGWTLQELIAPKDVEFYTSGWTLIGNKRDMAELIESLSGVDTTILRYERGPANVSIATRMSWAAGRETTRVEDRAYSLMGIFGVNMPTLYGEGDRAFTRLQYEIMTLSTDHSIFAWNVSATAPIHVDRGSNAPDSRHPACRAILADSPDRFSRAVTIVDMPHTQFGSTWNLTDPSEARRTPNGIQITLPVFNFPLDMALEEQCMIAVIACKLIDATHVRQYSLGLMLQRHGDSYCRVQSHAFAYPDSLALLDVPWTVETLVLLDRPDSTGANTNALDRQGIPRGLEIGAELTINAHTLEVLRGAHDFIVAPSSPGTADHTTTLAGTYYGIAPCTEVGYDISEMGDLIFTTEASLQEYEDTDNLKKLIFRQRPVNQRWGLGRLHTRRVLEMVAYRRRNSNDLAVVFSCVHPASKMAGGYFKPGRRLVSGLEGRYSQGGFQCGCGLEVQIDLAPTSSRSTTGAPRFILDVKIKEGPQTYGYTMYKYPPIMWLLTGLKILVLIGVCLYVAVVFLCCFVRYAIVGRLELPRTRGEKTYRRQKNLQWVETTAGFIPPDTLDFGNHSYSYVARIPQRYIDSGLSYDLARVGYTSTLPATRKVGSMWASPMIDYKLPSIAYEVLAGPPDSVRWIPCSGTFSIDQLRGASAIEGGRDGEGAIMYFARQTNSTAVVDYVGVVKVGSRAIVSRTTSSPHDSRAREVDRYEVLAHAHT